MTYQLRGLVPRMAVEVQKLQNSGFVPIDSKQNQTAHKKIDFSSSEFEKNSAYRPWKSHEFSSMETPAFPWVPRWFFALRGKVLALPNRTLFRFLEVDFTSLGIFAALAITVITIALVVVLRDDGEQSGNIVVIPLALTFSLAAHNNIWTFLLGSSYERGLAIHKIFGILTLGAGVFHGCWSYFKLEEEDNAVSGLILICLILFMLINSFFPVRKYFYRLFYFLHLGSAIAVIVLIFVHGAGLALIGVGFWAVDYITRIVIILINYSRTKKINIAKVPGQAVKIWFANPDFWFRYQAGQYCFLRVPGAGNLDKAHPLSIATAPGQRNVIFFAKQIGRWSRALANLAEKQKEVYIEVNGPYGTPSVDFQDEGYRIFVLFAGGIGLTPAKSIFEHLVSEFQRGRPLKKVLLIWSLRDSELIVSLLNEPDDFLNGYQREIERIQYFTDDKGVSRPYRPFEMRIHYTGQTLNISKPLHPLHETISQRPDLKGIFSEVERLSIDLGEKKVAVFACGPEAFVSKITGICSRKLCRSTVSFDLHSERFEF